MDYATIVSDKKLKGSGLERGQEVLVTGVKPVPASKKDPYLQRILAHVIKIVDGEHQIPSEKNDYLAYLLDPRSLEKVSDERKSELEEALRKQYEQRSL